MLGVLKYFSAQTLISLYSPVKSPCIKSNCFFEYKILLYQSFSFFHYTTY